MNEIIPALTILAVSLCNANCRLESPFGDVPTAPSPPFLVGDMEEIEELRPGLVHGDVFLLAPSPALESRVEGLLQFKLLLNSESVRGVSGVRVAEVCVCASVGIGKKCPLADAGLCTRTLHSSPMSDAQISPPTPTLSPIPSISSDSIIAAVSGLCSAKCLQVTQVDSDSVNFSLIDSNCSHY